MVTVGRLAYNLMYRFGAPWEGADRVELRALVADGRCAPETLRRPGAPVARAIDLGCGAGGVSLELAEAGFEVTGVDFSEVALRKARAAAERRGLGRDRVGFVAGDLTAGHVPGVEGPFDLLVDYGTLDDLPDAGRRAMAAYVTRLARPGSRLFLFAFSGRPEDLPRFSFGGPSRAFPGLAPGEVERRFAPAFLVECIEAPTRSRPVATYLLERTAIDAGDPGASLRT
jgi:SAM-dependent methyltransferase